MATAIDFSRLVRRFPPKHGERGPKRKPNATVTTILDRLPSQGTTDWKKQESIRTTPLDTSLWVPPPLRGASVYAPNNKRSKRKKG